MGRRSGSRGGERGGLLLLLGWLAACGGEPRAEPDEAPGDRPEPVRTDHVHDAVWSPDGRRLAVTWDRGAGARVYGLLAGTDSTPPEAGRGLPLSEGRGAWASWSPDGFWIAYESGGDLHRMRPDGTGDEPLTRNPASESHPAYAPDGARIAFVAGRDGEPPSLWLMAADGTDARPVPVDVEGRWRVPVWHPSGELLAAEASTAEGTGVYRVDPEEGTAVRMAMGGSPAFSPSGDFLWYARGDSIFRRPWEEGSAAAEELMTAPGHAPRPAPDGVRLAFVRGREPSGALYLLNLETGEELRLTQDAPPVGRRGGR